MADRPNIKKKGGATFPRMNLETAVTYARKLVAKTHTGAQKPDILYPGVFGSKGQRAQIRASGMKQYGLMQGSEKAGFTATDLAKALVHAPLPEVQHHLQEAALSPAVFKGLYDTFKGDAVSIAKVKQQAANLRVHPDNLEFCAALFVETMRYAGLGREDGDQVAFSQQPGSTASEELQADDLPDEQRASGDDEEEVPPPPPPGEREHQQGGEFARRNAMVNVSITVDSSMDAEKLERQLEILRRFGAI